MPESKKAKTEQKALISLQGEAMEKARKDFSQAVLCEELVNRLSLSFLSIVDKNLDHSKWLARQYPKAVESCFAELYKYSYHYALKLLGEPEQAEDIAQDSLKELLSTAKPISNLKAWLCRVTHNKAVAAIKKQNSQKKLLLKVQDQPPELPPNPDADDLNRKLAKDKIKKLLSKQDYKAFCELKTAGNLRSYAAQHGINYQTAKEHKHRIKVNLRSAYLKEQGWKDSQAILSYQQLRSIKRFIDRLLQNGGYTCHYKNPVLLEALKECTGLLTWEINMVAENTFHLILMCETTGLPSLLSMDIKLNRSNRITITSCKRGSLIATMPEGTAEPLSEEKGKAILNYSELLKLVPQATVYDKELFTDMLKELKDS